MKIDSSGSIQIHNRRIRKCLHYCVQRSLGRRPAVNCVALHKDVFVKRIRSRKTEMVSVDVDSVQLPAIGNAVAISVFHALRALLIGSKHQERWKIETGSGKVPDKSSRCTVVFLDCAGRAEAAADVKTAVWTKGQTGGRIEVPAVSGHEGALERSAHTIVLEDRISSAIAHIELEIGSENEPPRKSQASVLRRVRSNKLIDECARLA